MNTESLNMKKLIDELRKVYTENEILKEENRVLHLAPFVDQTQLMLTIKKLQRRIKELEQCY